MTFPVVLLDIFKGKISYLKKANVTLFIEIRQRLNTQINFPEATVLLSVTAMT